MSVQKLLVSFTALALMGICIESTDAQWYSGSYTSFYAPYTSNYGGYAPAGGNCCGNGSYTSYYGGGYGGNPFAPLVPGPRFNWFGFGRGYYSTGYAPYGYGNACGCSPCASGGCATGNCSLNTTNQPLKPTPEDNGTIPQTYDDEVPMDDPGFQPTQPDNGETDNFPGSLDSFKVPVEESDTPANETQPSVPLDANPAATPSDLFDLDLPRPITPRNSAQIRPTRYLENQITWRSAPVLVPERQALSSSRPLVVRKTIRVVPTQPLSVVSQSRVVK